MDIALLLLLHKALMGVQSQPPTAVQNGSTCPPCPPPCPKPSSAIYQIPLIDVKKLRIGNSNSKRKRDKAKVTPRPVTVTIPTLTGEQLTNWWMEATADIPVTSLPPGARNLRQ